MPKKLDIEKIIATNPNVDVNELKRATEVLKALQETGLVRPSTYGLETPDRMRQMQRVLKLR